MNTGIIPPHNPCGWDSRRTDISCECGAYVSGFPRDRIDTHFPRFNPGPNGSLHCSLADPFGPNAVNSLCRYSGRTVTLAAAIERDNALTHQETWAKRFGAGHVDYRMGGWYLKNLSALLEEIA